MEPNPDERLTNNLRLTLGKAKEVLIAISENDETRARECLSYVIAALETNIEWIRPEDRQPNNQTNKPFIQRIMP